MNQIEQLKKQLQEAEKSQHLEYLQKEFETVKKEYEGKCFATNTFERRNASASISATHYEKFFIRDDKIYVLTRYVSAHRHDAFYKKSKTDCGFSRHHSETCLTDGEHNASYNLYHGWSFFRHEISLDLFEQVWSKGGECYDLLNELFKAKLDHTRNNAITQGDHGKECQIEKGIEELKLDMIDFTKYPEVHRMIEFCTLPLFQEHRWLPTISAKQILEYQISKWEKELREERWLSVQQSSTLHNRISTIRNFIEMKLS